MTIHRFFFITALICTHHAMASGAPPNPAFATVEDESGLPSVLLIGDSISIGYTPFVREQLRGIANVHRAPENCGPTTRGLDRLDQWIGQRQWDVIHFNFGLHDVKYIGEQGQRVEPELGKRQVAEDDYRRNLEKILARLLATNARLVWCSTTPIPPGAIGRIPGDEIGYNEIALDIVTKADPSGQILVNDLYTFSMDRLADIQRPENVHFTDEGSRQLAGQVVAVIKQGLQAARPQSILAQGIVFHDSNGNGSRDAMESPLPGIRVSNGRDIVRTDQFGHYELAVSDDTILFVIKPRGWRTKLNENQLPRFFYIHKPNGSPPTKFAGVAPTGSLPASVDFPLYEQVEPRMFKAILFGDPQPSNQQEVDYIAHDVVEELIGTDASLGVTLGDIVNNDLSLFEPQARAIAVLGIPWYNVIGNHDLNFDAKHDKQSDESFERVFGPPYYSFDYGPVHFLVLDDVEWLIDDEGDGSYRGGLGEDQMEFIRNDLEAISNDQLVVLLMHIPLVDVHDRQPLYRLIEQRPFCMSVSAHRHVHYHRFITHEDGWQGPKPHHHVVNVTVSGSWWQGQADERGIPHATMSDGAPNGYSIISFDGANYQLEFKAAGRPTDYQMTIHAPESVELGSIADATVMVNVFNGSEKSKVEMRWQQSETWTRMEYAQVEDPAFRKIFDAEVAIRDQLLSAGVPKTELWKQLTGPTLSNHIWSGRLPLLAKTGLHVLLVRATDMDGRVFTDERLVRVEAGTQPTN